MAMRLREYSAKFDKPPSPRCSERGGDRRRRRAPRFAGDELKPGVAVAVQNIRDLPQLSQKLQAVDVETLPGCALPASDPALSPPSGCLAGRLSAAVLLHGADAGDAGAHRWLSAGGALLAAAYRRWILCAAQLCGVKTIFNVGGAQAIAASPSNRVGAEGG